MGGYAWVTLATNDSYSLGALVVAQSLRRVGTKHDIVVLVTPGVTSVMRERMASVFSLVQEVNLLDSKDKINLSLLARPELGVTFTKIHCWRLTQYEKCVFLDADTLVVRNCDELFEREELSAAPDVGWPDCFNSGVFVFRPSEETYASLVAFAVEKGSFDGGDQGLLNMYFSDWARKDISKHLPFIYNMCSTATYSYLPAFKQFGEDVRIIHFIGQTKPWLQYFDSLTSRVVPAAGAGHLQPLLQLWWNIFALDVHSHLSSGMARSTLATIWHTLAPVTPVPTVPHQSHVPDTYDETHSDSCSAKAHFTEFKDPWETYKPRPDDVEAYHESAPQDRPEEFFGETLSDSIIVTSRPDPLYQASEYSRRSPTVGDEMRHPSLEVCYQPASPENQGETYRSDEYHHVYHHHHHHHYSHAQTEDRLHEEYDLQQGPSRAEEITETHEQENSYSNHDSTVQTVHTAHERHTENGSTILPKADVRMNKLNGWKDRTHDRNKQTDSQKSCSPSTTVPPDDLHKVATLPESDKTGHLDNSHGGIAGALAQLTLGEARSAEQAAFEEHMRKQGWEQGQVDYMGRDSFDNIWKKISQTISQAPQRQPTPPKDEKEPEETVTETEDVTTTSSELEADVRKAEVIDDSPTVASLISKTPVENVSMEGTGETTSTIVSDEQLATQLVKDGLEPTAHAEAEVVAKKEAAEAEQTLCSLEKSSEPKLETEKIPEEPTKVSTDLELGTVAPSVAAIPVAAVPAGKPESPAAPEVVPQLPVAAVPSATPADEAKPCEVPPAVEAEQKSDLPPPAVPVPAEESPAVTEKSIVPVEQGIPKTEPPQAAGAVAKELCEKIAIAAETASASPVPIQVAESVLQPEPKTALESQECNLASEEAISTMIAPVREIAVQSSERLHENQACQLPAAVPCNGNVQPENDLPEACELALQREPQRLVPSQETDARAAQDSQPEVPVEGKSEEKAQVATPQVQQEAAVEPKESQVQQTPVSDVPKVDETVVVTAEPKAEAVATLQTATTDVKEPAKQQEVVTAKEPVVAASVEPQETVTPAKEPEAKATTAAETLKSASQEPAEPEQPETPSKPPRTKEQQQDSPPEAAASADPAAKSDPKKKTTKKLVKKSSEGSDPAEAADSNDPEKKTVKKVVKKVPKKPKDAQEETAEGSSSPEKPKKTVKIPKKSVKPGQSQETDASTPESPIDAPVPPKRKVKATKPAKPEAES